MSVSDCMGCHSLIFSGMPMDVKDMGLVILASDMGRYTLSQEKIPYGGCTLSREKVVTALFYPMLLIMYLSISFRISLATSFFASSEYL